MPCQRPPEPELVTFNSPYFGYPHHATRDGTKASPFAREMPPTHGLYRWHLPDPIYLNERSGDDG